MIDISFYYYELIYIIDARTIAFTNASSTSNKTITITLEYLYYQVP